MIETNEEAIIAMKYVQHLYLRPEFDKLIELLAGSKITWICHQGHQNTIKVCTQDEFATLLQNGPLESTIFIKLYDYQINRIDEINYEIKTKTMQYWNGASNINEGNYKIDSVIRFKFCRNSETSKMVISEVEHEYWITLE